MDMINGNWDKKMNEKIKITVWYEYVQEAGFLCDNVVEPGISEENYRRFSDYVKWTSDEIHRIYPQGLMAPVVNALRQEPDFEVRYTTMYDPEYGLPGELLDDTDVLIWWAHTSHDKLPDHIAARVVERIHMGMGFIALHSAHKSKPFTMALGTRGTLKWRNGDFCRVWNISPAHPIASGIPEYIELDEEEMYGEPFDIPKPDDIIFMSWFRGGEVLRSGCTWTRGYGKIFYFQPGHETNPAYHNPYIQKIICNAARWAAPVLWRENLDCPNAVVSPEEKYRRSVN